MIDDSVRSLIREVLAEELKRFKAGRRDTSSGAREETVAIGSDADLAGFVTRLLGLAADSKTRRDIEQGRLVFRLAGGAGRSPAAASASASVAQAGDTVRMDRGVMSERQVDALPKGTRTLLAGRDVKLTPLARDRLRQRGIKIERAG